MIQREFERIKLTLVSDGVVFLIEERHLQYLRHEAVNGLDGNLGAVLFCFRKFVLLISRLTVHLVGAEAGSADARLAVFNLVAQIADLPGCVVAILENDKQN